MYGVHLLCQRALGWPGQAGQAGTAQIAHKGTGQPLFIISQAVNLDCTQLQPLPLRHARAKPFAAFCATTAQTQAQLQCQHSFEAPN